MAKQQHPTPMLDELEKGPWPSFVTGLKRLAADKDYVVDVLGQLETSYKTRKGYWKGGTVGVIGYGGGVIPRFTELKDDEGRPVFKDAAEFHTLRVMPPPGMHYDTGILRKMCDIWERHGSGLIAFHGQSGDIMFQGCTTENVQKAFDEINELGFDLGGAGPAVRTSMSCVGAARCEQSCYDEARAHRAVINTFLDDIHRPSLPYKFKFKFSGCPNDCMNSIQRADMAIIGMVYASIRIIREWASGLTVVNYLVLGMGSGATLGATLAALLNTGNQEGLALGAMTFIVTGLATRGASLVRNARIPAKTTLQTAIGVKHPKIAQRSQGAMGGSFNTREFFHGQGGGALRNALLAFLVLGCILPLMLLAFGFVSAVTCSFAFAIQFAGLMAERWLFFAEARHPQNLYYQSIA